MQGPNNSGGKGMQIYNSTTSGSYGAHGIFVNAQDMEMLVYLLKTQMLEIHL